MPQDDDTTASEATRAHILVLGNAKGGCGKSTMAMHIVARLLAMGLKVGAVDLDGQQQTLGRYLQNRARFAAQNDLALLCPELHTIVAHRHLDRRAEERAVYDALCAALEVLVPRCEVVVVDCPGSDTFVARLGHEVADTLLTPVNDSFVDLDLLAHVDPHSFAPLEPGWYSEMVWELRKRRLMRDGHRVDWLVMRNRLSHIEARNKRHVGHVLQALAPRFGFRLAAGMGERVIFRELFLKGLTLSDLRHHNTGVTKTMTHIVAHQEVKRLMQNLQLQRMPVPEPLALARQAAP